MIRTFLAAVALLLCASVADADVGLRFAALGYQQITLSGAASLTVPAGATSAVITAEAQAVRYRDDGVAPTATVGMPLAVGVPLQYTGPLASVKFIQQTSGAILNILYYK
jgi:hypothetical protein